MTQQDRDRLVAFEESKEGLITQRQAAVELGHSERHIRRLLKQLKARGDKAVVQALRGRPSNRKLDERRGRRRRRYWAAMPVAVSARPWQRNTWPANTIFSQDARRCGPG
jgi:predicted ArsR family transcriptional regulator